MANDEHVALIRAGVEGWNVWRSENHQSIPHGVNPVLAGADLSGLNLAGADLIFANLEGADLSYADLTSASLSNANLRGADLAGAVLWDADFREAILTGAKGLQECEDLLQCNILLALDDTLPREVWDAYWEKARERHPYQEEND